MPTDNPLRTNDQHLSWDWFDQRGPTLKKWLSTGLDCTVRWHEPSAEHVTFRAGGPIGALCFPTNESALVRLVQMVVELDLVVLMLGRGSNTLIRDGGFPGVIIKMTENMAGLTIRQNEVSVLAGTSLHALAHATASAGLEGLEWSSDIPGTLGGGLFMNAGLNECSLSHAILQVTSLDPRTGSSLTYERAQCDFGYRHSRFQASPEIILSAVFMLREAGPAGLIERMNEIARTRQAKYPLEFPNAGSIFKRPPGHYAGALIEQAGLKGKCRGQAMVSPKHANFIVNTGQATATDIEDLIEEIQAIIWKRNAVRLQPEIRIFGIRARN
ncbi:UDP-N-acetylmuramate dehydrogenase [bacterium]|nr:UDP-N-acetylmuramate dehydrogenase [bacterium]